MVAKKKFYVTTAIDYVNAEPHMGHAYQKIIADIISRWNKLDGKDVFFLSGTDEHGLNIERKAREAGKTPKEFCDEISGKFREAWKKLDIQFDRFIRTTDKDHEALVKKFVGTVWKNNDIYKGIYEGWYCAPCEAFYTEKDLVNDCCPVHKKPVEKVKEETYYFRMSRYQKKLLALYEKNPEFILPESRRHEITNRVKEGLQDMSITRTTFKWGIPFPYDDKHVLYVWFDALVNYLSGAGKNQEYWPADLHLLGKDNAWFHCVLWPSMLMSAKEKLPKSVFVHGFMTVNGEKISKTRGNVISPVYLAEKYGTDAVRYFITRQIPFGDDGDFSETALKDRHNNELANKLGNLVSRTAGMCKGEYKKSSLDNELNSKLKFKEIKADIEKYEFDRALSLIFEYIDECNNYVQRKEPWKLEGKEKQTVLYNLVDSIRVISILLESFIPGTCEKIRGQFGFDREDFKKVKFGLTKSGKIEKSEILFKKIE